MVMLSVPFALVGGVYLVWLLGLQHVGCGLGRLHRPVRHRGGDRGGDGHLPARGPGQEAASTGRCTEQDIYDATFEGAVLRLRPKLMTVAVALLGLVPIMWSSGTGADVMKPIAAPMIGGMISSAIHVLIMTPVIFVLMKKRDLKKGKLKYSGMKH